MCGKDRLRQQKHVGGGADLSSLRCVAAAVFSLWVAIGAVDPARSDTAILEVTGRIGMDTCSLSAADENRIVTLPTLSVAALPPAGKAAASTTPFRITVENCPPGLVNAEFTFAGTPDTNDGLRYLNTGTSTGIAVELASATDHQTIGADGTNNVRVVAISGTQAVLDLEASYWRIPVVTLNSGTVRAMATVQVTYH